MPAARPVWTRPLTPALVLGLLVVVALTAALTWFVTRPAGAADDSAEAGFARDMSTHHAQAVEMSLLAIEGSDSRDVVTLATDIATTQGNQVGRMQTWLEDWGLTIAGTEPRMAWMTAAGEDPEEHLVNGRMPGLATPSQLTSLADAEGEEADVLYLQLMTTHHIAGVEMAEAILDRSDDPQVTRLAEGMVTGQESEIDLMTGMLEDRGAQTQEAMGELAGDDGTGELPRGHGSGGGDDTATPGHQH